MLFFISLSIVRHTGHFCLDSVPLWLIFIPYAKPHALYLQFPMSRSYGGATDMDVMKGLSLIIFQDDQCN